MMPRSPLWRRWRTCLVLAFSIATSACQRQVEQPVQQTTFVTASSLALTQELVTHYNRVLPFAHVSLKSAGGAVAVVSDLHTGAGQIGIAQQADAVYLAYRHGVESDPVPYVNIRGIAVLWRNLLTVVVRDDGQYRSLTDLRGKRIGIFRPGTATEFLSRALLSAYGMSYSDVRPLFQSSTATAASLENGELDAAILVTPVLPDTITAGLKQNGHLRVLSITRPIIKELLRTQPFLHPVVMSPRDWSNQSGDLETVGIDALLLCRDDLGEEAVYQFTKEFFAALPELAMKNPEAAAVNVEKAPATPIPLHPGAARYYREREVLK
jgi:TRAP transporter TAXI family solute receptor